MLLSSKNTALGINMSHKNEQNCAKKWMAMGAVLAALSVILGAFAAHALKSSLSEYQLGIVETGVRYQMYHALAIILIAFIATQINIKTLSLSLWCFTVGSVFFSGSLYLLALFDFKWVVYFTPLGGFLFIVGWLAFVFRCLQKKETR